MNFKNFETTSFGSQFRTIYAPNFKEVGGAYCFWVVRPSVRPSFRPSVRPSVRHAF